MDINLYTMLRCEYCHEYIIPKWRLNQRLPMGSKITGIDIHLDPRQDAPRRILGRDTVPMVTITKEKVKPLFKSAIRQYEYTTIVGGGVNEKANYWLLKKLTEQG